MRKIRNHYDNLNVARDARCGISISLAVFFTVILNGCTSLAVGIQGIKYPQDTAILIDDTPYLINTFKCATIKEIQENRRLICYDLEGRRSAKVPPASENHRDKLKIKFGIEWASPEHQEELFNWYYGGGKEAFEKAVRDSVAVSMQLAMSVNDLSKSLDRSRKMKIQEMRLRQKGIDAHISGGMPAWQAHQFNVVQWHLDNASYFRNKAGDAIYFRHEDSQPSDALSREARLICMAMDGAAVFATDGVFLGTISNRHESDSIFNESGEHGGVYSSVSIWNQHGSYGGQHAAMSPFNLFASSPPLIFKDGIQVATLTVSSTAVSPVSPWQIKSCGL